MAYLVHAYFLIHDAGTLQYTIIIGTWAVQEEREGTQKAHAEEEATLHDGHDRAPAPLHLAQVALPLSRLVAACTAMRLIRVRILQQQ